MWESFLFLPNKTLKKNSVCGEGNVYKTKNNKQINKTKNIHFDGMDIRP